MYRKHIIFYNIHKVKASQKAIKVYIDFSLRIIANKLLSPYRNNKNVCRPILSSIIRYPIIYIYQVVLVMSINYISKYLCTLCVFTYTGAYSIHTQYSVIVLLSLCYKSMSVYLKP